MKNILLIIIIAVAAYFGIQYINNQPEEVEVETTQEVSSTSTADVEYEEAPEDAYVVQTQESSITWEGKKPAGGHVGTVDIESGYVTEDFQGVFVIDMTTIYTPESEVVTNHLKSEDFFDVEEYPNAYFKVTGYEEGVLYGDLTVRDTTKEIGVPAGVSFEGDTMVINGNYQLNRTDFGINFRSGSFFENLGDSLIEDMVDLQIEVRAQR